jgi:hypothetical protein
VRAAADRLLDEENPQTARLPSEDRAVAQISSHHGVVLDFQRHVGNRATIALLRAGMTPNIQRAGVGQPMPGLTEDDDALDTPAPAAASAAAAAATSVAPTTATAVPAPRKRKRRSDSAEGSPATDTTAGAPSAAAAMATPTAAAAEPDVDAAVAPAAEGGPSARKKRTSGAQKKKAKKAKAKVAAAAAAAAPAAAFAHDDDEADSGSDHDAGEEKKSGGGGARRDSDDELDDEAPAAAAGAAPSRLPIDRAMIPIIADWISKFDAGKAAWKFDMAAKPKPPKVKKGEKKPKGAEGSCDAKITFADGSALVTGKFTGTVHAEINALAQVANPATIAAIQISSPPCPRCAVVLQALGLSAKVHLPKGSSSRLGPSWGWGGALADLMGHIAPSASAAHHAEILRRFSGGAWATLRR